MCPSNTIDVKERITGERRASQSPSRERPVGLIPKMVRTINRIFNQQPAQQAVWAVRIEPGKEAATG
jgi:hypothetical protein